MTGADQGKLSFGDKLAYLIETVHPPDRGRCRYREIAAEIAEHPRAMTAAHINQLVRGFAGEAVVLDAPVRHSSLSCIHSFTERGADVSRTPTLRCRSYTAEGNEGKER